MGADKRSARALPRGSELRAGARVRREGDTAVVEVDHVEGKVRNVLRNISATRLDLDEFKRRYDATFRNEFVAEGGGMRTRSPPRFV